MAAAVASPPLTPMTWSSSPCTTRVGTRTGALGRVRVPTLVVHGEEDQVIGVSGGEATAAAIPGARLLRVPGLGHELPPGLWPTLADALVENADLADGG